MEKTKIVQFTPQDGQGMTVGDEAKDFDVVILKGQVIIDKTPNSVGPRRATPAELTAAVDGNALVADEG